jgi:hypothetical protein
MTPIRKQKYGDDWAMFLPSISQMYVLAHAKNPPWPRQPIPFDLLNFLDKNNENHFHYPYGLYSAGHAHLDPQKSTDREIMVQQRDRQQTIMVGDSGGFQAATGVLDFDWKDPLGEKANAQRIELLRWLEHTSDYSMVLDWPAWAIPTGRLPTSLMIADPTTGELTNDPFNNCLNGTVWNNEFFIQNRVPGATQFLNVLQGRNTEEAHKWYDAVTPFSSKAKYGDRAFEGWALGGSTGGDPSLTMPLLIRLRDDGLLTGEDRWIHVLGRSRLSTAVYLTSLNRALKKHVNPGIQVSYDAASAFLYAVNGNYVVDKQVSPKGLNLISAEFPMHAKHIGSSEPMIYNMNAERRNDPTHYKSPISKMLTMGDFMLAPDEKSKKDYRMDTAAYYYIMAHNLQMQLEALEFASSKVGAPDAIDFLPTIHLEFDDFIHRLLKSETPMTLIEKEAGKFKDLISGERDGVSALEDQSMFPKPSTLADITHEKRKNTKPVKVAMAGTAINLNDIFGQQADGSA